MRGCFPIEVSLQALLSTSVQYDGGCGVTRRRQVWWWSADLKDKMVSRASLGVRKKSPGSPIQGRLGQKMGAAFQQCFAWVQLTATPAVKRPGPGHDPLHRLAGFMPMYVHVYLYVIHVYVCTCTSDSMQQAKDQGARKCGKAKSARTEIEKVRSRLMNRKLSTVDEGAYVQVGLVQCAASSKLVLSRYIRFLQLN